LMVAGNPLWTGFCMVLSLLYAMHVHACARKSRAADESSGDVNDAEVVVRTWLQAPVQLDLEPATLIAFVKKHEWWATSAAILSRTEMNDNSGFYFPFILAIVVWLWTLVTACYIDQQPGKAASGNNLEWQISIGSLFLWMVSDALQYCSLYHPKSLCRA
jgi:hypothetical protein